jgi:hypothetical protein
MHADLFKGGPSKNPRASEALLSPPSRDVGVGADGSTGGRKLPAASADATSLGTTKIGFGSVDLGLPPV